MLVTRSLPALTARGEGAPSPAGGGGRAGERTGVRSANPVIFTR